jgi:hypothetical protein
MATEELEVAKYLTDEQRKVLDEVEADLTRAFEAARAKKSAANFPGPTNGSFQCLSCDCEGFVSSNTRPPRLFCARPGCGHSFFRHDVF